MCRKGRQIVMSTLARGLIYSFSDVLARLVNLAGLSIILFYCSKESFGEFQYYVSISSLLLSFSNIGMDAVLYREMSGRLRNATGWLKSCLFLKFKIFCAVILGLILFFKGKNIVYLAVGSYLMVFGENLIQMGSNWCRSRKKPWHDFFLTFIRSLAVLVALYYFVSSSPKSSSILSGYCVGLVVCIFTLFINWRKVFSSFSVDLVPISIILKNISVFALIEVIGSLYIQLPLIYLGNNQLYYECGVYSAYFKILAPFSIIVGAFTKSYQVDYINSLRSDSSIESEQFYKKNMTTQIYMGLISGGLVIAFGGYAASYLGKIESVDYSVILSFGLMPIGIALSGFIDATLVASRKEKFIFISHSVSLIFLVIVVFFIK